MNNDLQQFSEERLKELAEMCESKALGFPASHAESAALARIALSVKQAKPVAWKLTHVAGAVSIEFNKEVADLFGIFNGNTVEPLYTTQQPAHTEQDGWKLVPIQPTEEMINAWGEDMGQSYASVHAEQIGEDELVFAYQAMIAAAPKPETE